MALYTRRSNVEVEMHAEDDAAMQMEDMLGGIWLLQPIEAVSSKFGESPLPQV